MALIYLSLLQKNIWFLVQAIRLAKNPIEAHKINRVTSRIKMIFAEAWVVEGIQKDRSNLI